MLRVTFAFSVLLFSAAIAGFAQLATTTALVGTVADASGAPLEAATITAVETSTHETYTGTTGSTGDYNIQFVKIGTYNVSVSHAGFETMTKTGVVVEINQVVRTDFSMTVGQVSQNITVVAFTPAIATDDATVASVLNTKQTVDLPLNGRDSLRLATVVPTVLPGLKTPAGNPGGGEDFVAAGVREIDNSVSLDGVSIMNNLITTTTFRPSVDAVQEVQVQTGTYPAQYGGYMGLQLNLMTKSGANDFHGSLFEFVRNNYFDARGYFQAKPTPQAPFRQNQFGVEFAGPVDIPKLYNGRNRTFFMFDYEGLRNSQVTAQSTLVLTQAERQGDFSAITTPLKNPFTGAVFPGNIIPQILLSPQAQAALQYMPLPNSNGATGNYLAAVANANDTNQTIGRLDQTLGEKTHLFFRYAWEDTGLLNGSTNPYNGYNQPVTDRNFVIGYTQTFTPNMVNDLRFGRQHTTIDSINFFTGSTANAGTDLGIPGFTSSASNPGLPDISITGFQAIGGENQASTNWYQTDTTWQGTDVLNYTHGRHSISAGAEIRKLITLRTANNNPRGLLDFTGQESGNAAADFILGVAANLTTPGQLFPGGAVEYRDGFFFSDKWQVTSRLNLTIGLRYELPTVPESTNGNGTILNATQTAFIPATVPQKIPYIDPNHKDFAPRLGFAYRVNDRFVVRGGYGIYYNPNQLNSFTLATTNPPFSTIYTYNSSATQLLTLANPEPASAQGVLPKPNAFTLNPYLPTPYLQQWSFDIQKQLWRNAGFTVQYLGNHAEHLDRSYYDNQPLPGPGAVDPRRPNQDFRQIRVIQNDEISNFNAMNLVFTQNTFHGLTMTAAYTWSHALDVSTDSNGGGAPMDPYNWKLDYGNANWDVRHRFVGTVIYELPWLKHNANRFVTAALGNWQINSIVTAQTGFPFNVVVPGDPANIGLSGSERPNIVGTPTSNCGDGHLTNCIDPAAFALPAAYTFGDASRNLLYGPGLVDVDLSLFKNFGFREHAVLQIRGEAFNVLNHPSFSNPSTTLGTATFGTITSTSNNNRQIQLAARFTF